MSNYSSSKSYTSLEASLTSSKEVSSRIHPASDTCWFAKIGTETEKMNEIKRQKTTTRSMRLKYWTHQNGLTSTQLDLRDSFQGAAETGCIWSHTSFTPSAVHACITGGDGRLAPSSTGIKLLMEKSLSSEFLRLTAPLIWPLVRAAAFARL